jgi:hypothetical protein
MGSARAAFAPISARQADAYPASLASVAWCTAMVRETQGESRGQQVWHVYRGHGPLPLDEFHDPEADRG